MKKKSLLSTLQTIPPERQKSWFDKLDKEQQAELLEIREAYQSQKLPSHVSARIIYEQALASGIPIPVKCGHFSLWLRGGNG